MLCFGREATARAVRAHCTLGLAPEAESARAQ